MSTPAASPEVPVRKSWTAGMAPAYIGTFLWVAFLDKIGARALPVGGLVPALGGVIAAAALTYLLLFRVPAFWGFSTGRPLDDVATSTFGTRGALAVPNLVLAIAQIFLFAIAVGYAAGWTLDGFRVLGLLEARAVQPVAWGSLMVPSPLFLTTALVWGVITALVGMLIVRWIAAIMQYFPVFPAIGLALAMAGALTGLGDFLPTHLDPGTGRTLAVAEGWQIAFLTTFQWTFAFSAILGITGADWGAASLSVGDVRNGGLVSLAVTPVIVASLALLAIAGNDGRAREGAATTTPVVGRSFGPASAIPGLLKPDEPGRATPTPQSTSTLRYAVEGSLDRRLAGTVLIIFGLASLAPACYAAFDFGRRLLRVAPGLSKLTWTLMGVASAWFLIVGDWHERTELIFSILGAFIAPIAGAMVADVSRHRRTGWPEVRPGVNRAGLLAWTVGSAVGLIPVVAQPLGLAQLVRLAPAALGAFLAAFLIYRVAAPLGLEPRASATPNASDPA